MGFLNMQDTPEFWYGDKRTAEYYFSLPFSWLIGLYARIKRLAYQLHLIPAYRSPVPVIVVGNITAGGTGKSPLVIWLARFLKDQGYKPGIISRGYGGRATSWPQQVRSDSDVKVVGDEAVMIASRAKCPMAVGPIRKDAIKALLQHHDIDVIISDDGLQHYAMARDVEIAVVHGERRLGNERFLPAGPLREPPSRLDDVDIVVVNGKGLRNEHAMTVGSEVAVNMKTRKIEKLSVLKDRSCHAVAGIGYPDGFFNALRAFGIEVKAHPYPDHHYFEDSDIMFGDTLPVLMTEKDAVKCMRFADKNHWCVPLKVTMDRAFQQRVLMLLKKHKK